MLRNYLKVAFRNLWKNKAFSAINIIGLSVGLAVCLLIVLYVVDELSYDKYNAHAGQIYRLDSDIYFNGTGFNSSTSPEPMPVALVKEYPRLEQMVRISNPEDILVKKDNQNIQNHNAVFADSTFFNVFTVSMIQGNPLTALNEPHSIVIDETNARKYFNSTDVVGKSLYINNSGNCKVTGVIKDFPKQSHFHFGFIRPMRDSYRGNEQDWLSNNGHSYILVKEGTTQKYLQEYVNAVINKYLMRELEQIVHTNAQDMKKQGNHFIYHVMPLLDIHLRSDKSYEFEANGSVTYVYIFSAIAGLILLIACVNFMNLSTARSANRAKEVGIRKVAGSTRSNLVIQFLTESVLLSFLSLLLALLFSAVLLPLFNQLAGKEMLTSTLFSTWLLPVMIALVFVVGCVAGSYPAFYLSAFQPIKVLKGAIATGFKSNWLRSGLVVFQFCISIMLIIGTIVIYDQLDFIQRKKIGFNRDQVLILHNTYTLDKQIKSFRQEVLKIPGVENATISGDLPTSAGFNQNGWFRDATLDAKRVAVMTNFGIDENYIPALGMQMQSGRNFSKDFPTDSSAVILNEAAVKLLGLKEPLKEFLYRPSYNEGAGAYAKAIPYHIVGVVKDFNFSSMHDKVGPLIIQNYENTGNIAMRISTKDIPSLVTQVEDKWNSMAPGQPFHYSFMDADFNKIYNAEQRTGKLFITFAVIAILIACLGLFGLVTYAAEQRTKEIGIRKVLGAKVSGLVALLSKDFMKLVFIASLVAFPVSWWAMNKWLQSFAYRIAISWWIFALALLIAIMIALLTVSIQAIKAALANPIRSLRTE
jgi:putative ABC transport system permease protein